MELQHAFKEWAVICRALAQGKQALILRKGGIAETGGEFAVERTRFWLYPTYVHQQRDEIKPEAHALLKAAEAEKPQEGIVRLSHWAEVTGIYRVLDLTFALMLPHLHYWSEEAIRKRFAYREPGINVLTVRVFQAPVVHELVETAAYLGCKSWVELASPLPTEGSKPVLSDKEYQDVKWHLDMLLNPTALA
jgi:hypothetical protein